MDGLYTTGVEEHSFSGRSFARIDMCLPKLGRAFQTCDGFQLTAIPMFLTLDSRWASSADRLSMMVSCDRESGSEASSSLERNVSTQATALDVPEQHTSQQQLQLHLASAATACLVAIVATATSGLKSTFAEPRTMRSDGRPIGG